MVKKKKKRMSVAGSILLVIFLAGAVVGIYFAVTNKKDTGKLEANVELTEAEKLIEKDLAKDYPVTVREVMNLYCRITKCVYNDDITADEMEKLNRLIRGLYDDELLGKNTEEEQLSALNGDVAHYHSNKMSINSYTIDKSDKISYKETDSREYATLNMYFTLKENTVFNRAYEEFMLRKSDDGKWKIVGWRELENADVVDEG